MLPFCEFLLLLGGRSRQMFMLQMFMLPGIEETIIPATKAQIACDRDRLVSGAIGGS